MGEPVTSMPKRAFTLLCLVGLCWASTGCFATHGPALPDLSEQHTEIEQRSQRLERIIGVMTRDLGRVETLRQEFAHADATLYQPPFPLDLYKQVAVSCLNKPWDSSQLHVDASDGDAEAGLNLSCQPEFGHRLAVELQEQVPERRAQALAKLRTLDELRQLRGRLRQRLSRVPAIVQASRSLLAARRAELRQMRAAQSHRRTEYSQDRWQQLQKRLEGYEQQLQHLQEHIERLAEAWPTWGPSLDQSVSMLYMELTKLSP